MWDEKKGAFHGNKWGLWAQYIVDAYTEKYRTKLKMGYKAEFYAKEEKVSFNESSNSLALAFCLM